MSEIKYLPEQRRFQIDIDGLEAGHISYTEENGGWNVVHTEVSPNFRGRGIAKMLVDALMGVERQLKRVRDSKQAGCGPRTIDCDLCWVEDEGATEEASIISV